MAPHEKTERRGMNAFTSVRPRGAGIPAKVPVQRKKKAVPITYSNKRVLNVNGKLQAPLNPNASNSIVIESRAQAQASNDKTRAITRGLS
ncbi:MAG: hypothetical protein QG572_1934 [Pseudomonadota bacterium]|nr:hypothetical protein [Pseudomonadota bacterium]